MATTILNPVKNILDKNAEKNKVPAGQRRNQRDIPGSARAVRTPAAVCRRKLKTALDTATN